MKMEKKISGVKLIAKERQRQRDKEGWNDAHDAGRTFGELAQAASVYAMPNEYRTISKGFIPDNWPWEPEWWKPTPENRVKELVKAGALIAAEIDRLQALQKLSS